MDSIRRLGALVIGVLVLQLSLAAGLSQCDEPAAVAQTAHAGMSMPAESESCSSDAAGTDCAPSDHGACEAVMSCMTAVFNPAMQAQLTVAAARDIAPTDPVTLFQTRSTVPDLPPPRA
ncbi:MAG: hypothetical protein WDZ58_07585 [Gemmatimonadaceae bacterium]